MKGVRVERAPRCRGTKRCEDARHRRTSPSWHVQTQQVSGKVEGCNAKDGGGRWGGGGAVATGLHQARKAHGAPRQSLSTAGMTQSEHNTQPIKPPNTHNTKQNATNTHMQPVSAPAPSPPPHPPHPHFTTHTHISPNTHTFHPMHHMAHTLLFPTNL